MIQLFYMAQRLKNNTHYIVYAQQSCDVLLHTLIIQVIKQKIITTNFQAT